MKKVVVGLAIGALGSYLVYRLAKDGKLDCLCDDFNKITSQTKKKIKDGLDSIQNNIECLEERLKFKSHAIKECIEDATDKIK